MQSLVIVHATALLAEPRLGSAVLALLSAGATCVGHQRVEGFWRASGPDGRAGFVLAALCAATPGHAACAPPPTIRVRTQTMLYRRPSFAEPYTRDADQWFLVPSEPLLVLSRRRDQLLVQRADSQRGYVPQAVCAPTTDSRAPQVTRVAQQTTLQRVQNSDGDPIWLYPNEPLLVLGTEQGFVLVQRDDGRMGYIAAAQQHAASNDELARVGRLDLGWIGLGGGWLLLNWGGVSLATSLAAGLAPTLAAAGGLTLVLGLVAFLWLGSPRRYAARSFALGVLALYALLHFLTSGWATGWQG